MPEKVGASAKVDAARLACPAGGHASRRYLAYPHSNGFFAGGRFLVFGQCGDREFGFWRRDVTTGAETRLFELPRGEGDLDMRWFDVAGATGRMVVIDGNNVWCCELDASPGEARPELAYREPSASGAALVDLPSLSADGSRLLCNRVVGGRHQVIEIAMEGAGAGRARVLLEFPWHANHVQFSPHDERWIGFCHEGPTEKVGRRVWGWHASLAPESRCLFDNGAAGLCVGHERWAFHAASVFVVAYGVSPGRPRGVYEIFPENTGAGSARLVSEGDRDWHVDVSRDGRWAVVDTTGPHDAPGRGWENAGDVSDVVLIDTATGRREFLARSRFHARHPRHLHPVFSPDGAVIFYNESGVNGDGHCIRAVANPWWSPAV